MSPYSYNSSNQLTSTPSATFTYDGNGNAATKADANGATTYTWDFENRLTSVVLPASGGTVTFMYDPFGRRIQKSSSSGTTNYLYDGSNSVEELDHAGAETAHYAQGTGIDEPLAALRGGIAGFYEQDGLGSITTLTDSTGAMLNSYTYDSFGNLSTSTGSFVNPYQYTGRDYDSETGLQYYRARYYYPTIGRFLSEDPLGFEAGANFYNYVQNDPVNWADPFGESPLSYDQIANLVAANNHSGQTNELIICMAFMESTFDPDADQPGFINSARGLMGITDQVATQEGVDYESLHDPGLNISTGTTYLAWAIKHKGRGDVRLGLAHYGPKLPYANALLKCEKCLINHSKADVACKTKDCLAPMHPAPRNKKRHARGRQKR